MKMMNSFTRIAISRLAALTTTKGLLWCCCSGFAALERNSYRWEFDVTPASEVNCNHQYLMAAPQR